MSCRCFQAGDSPRTQATRDEEADSEQAKDELAERQARAAVALVRLGHADQVWPLLRHSADPRLRSFIVNWLNPLGADPRRIAAELLGLDSRRAPVAPDARRPAPQDGRHPLPPRDLDAPGADPGPGDLRDATRSSPAGEREPLIPKLLDLYRNDPDAGIHGAADGPCGSGSKTTKLKAVDAELSKLKDRGDRRWYVNSQGQTFA